MQSLLPLLALPLICASPIGFPLDNGFPFPSDEELEKLFSRAGGNFTNAPLAPAFDDDSLTSWKLQAFNEFMEVAFFTQLIANITDGVPGYELDREERGSILNALETIQAVCVLERDISSRVSMYISVCHTDQSSKRKCTPTMPTMP